MQDALDHWDYRRRIEAIYDEVRRNPEPASAWRQWCGRRDELFRWHPQSPVSPSSRPGFIGLRYFAYDPAWRLEGTVVPLVDRSPSELAHSADGSTPFRPFGRLEAPSPLGPLTLTLYWLEGYGGGVFLPFRDATNGDETYGGGRYLLDTVKGADLGHTGGQVIADFNFAYHPSCVHDDRWSCPLAPVENRLSVPVRVGERV